MKTLTETSNGINEFCEKGEVEEEQNYRNALDYFKSCWFFFSFKWSFLVNCSKKLCLKWDLRLKNIC